MERIGPLALVGIIFFLLFAGVQSQSTTNDSGIYIEGILVQDNPLEQGKELQSVTVLVKNVRQASCAGGIVGISFATEFYEPVSGIGLLEKNGQTLERGITKIEFLPADYPALHATANLSTGNYTVRAKVYCPAASPLDGKAQFFTVTPRQSYPIPETNQFLTTAIVLALAVILLQKRK